MGQVISNLDVCDQKAKEESTVDSSHKEYILQAQISSEIQHLQSCFQIYKKDGERSSDMPKISTEVIINNITQQALTEYFQTQNQSSENSKSNSSSYDALQDLNRILSQKLSLRNSQRSEEILQIYDHLEYRMRASPLNVQSFLQEKNLTENTENLQGSSIDTLISQKKLNVSNEELKIGFKTPESHIEMLKTFQNSSNISGNIQSSFGQKNKSFLEQYFHISDQTQLESSYFRSIISKQIFILYCIYLQRQKLNEEDKKDFFDYISQFLNIPKDIEKSQNENEKKEIKIPHDTLPKLSFQDAKSQIMLETGLKFSLSLLNEIGKIDKSSLKNSLGQLLLSLKDQRPGCLYSTTDKNAFQLEENLNEARELLTNIINQNIANYDSNISQQLIEYSLKIIFTLGILRSNVEDFLQVLTILHEINSTHKNLGIQIDLTEEIQMIFNFYGFDQAHSVQKQNKISEEEKNENNIGRKHYKLGQMNLLTTTSIKMNLNSGDLSYIKGSLGDKLIADDEYFYIYKSQQDKGMNKGIYKVTQACQMQNSQGAAFRMAGKNIIMNTSQIFQERSTNGLDSHMFIIGKYIFMKYEVPQQKSQNSQSDIQKSKSLPRKEDEAKLTNSDELLQSKLMIIDSQTLEPLQTIVQYQNVEANEQKKEKSKEENKKLIELQPITANLDHVPSWKNQQIYKNQDICFDSMPMITDGKHLYIFGRNKLKKKEGENQKYQIVINIYKIDSSEELPKFNFERQITLLWKNNEAFERDENSLIFMGQISQWSTNGEVIVCFSKTNKYLWFDSHTGMLISEQSASCEHNDHTLIYYNYNQSHFIRMQTRDHGTDCHRYWIFNFQNFKVQNQLVVQKHQLNLIRKKLFNQKNQIQEFSYQKQNIIKNLMKKQKKQPILKNEESQNEKLNIDSQYCLILDFINKFIKSKFQIFYEEMKNKAHTTNRVEDILKLFKFQNCTYLTENFFILLADNLFSMKSLISNPHDINEKQFKNISDNEQSIVNQYSLLYILNLVNANFQALSHCQIKLSYLLDNESDENQNDKGYKYFMAAFEEIIVAIVEKGAHKQCIAEIQDGDIKEELTYLWRQIEDISKEIIDQSVSLLHQDPSSMVEILLSTLNKPREEISLQNVCVQISYLNLKDNLRKVIEHPKIQDLTVKIFEFYSNFIIKKYEEVEKESNNQDQENDNLAEITMRDYILNYSQLILQRYCETQENLIKYHKKLLQKQVQQQIEKHQEHKHFKPQNNEVMVTIQTLEKDKWAVDEAELNEGYINLNKYEKPLIFIINLTYTYLQTHVQTIYDLLQAFSQQVINIENLDQFETQKLIAEKQIKQVSFSNQYSNILKNRNVFYEMCFLYAQTLTLLKLDSFENHNSLAMVNFVDKFMQTIHLCSQFQSLEIVKLKVQSEKSQKNKNEIISMKKRCPELFMTVDAIFRQLTWLLCQTASKMINISHSEKEDAKQSEDQSKGTTINKGDNEKISDHYKKNLLNIKESSLLAGGIETRYLTQVISKERQKILRTYLMIIQDKYLQEQLQINQEQNNDYSIDDDRILKAIINEGIDESTEYLIKCIQKSFESKIPIVHARLAGQNGLKMTRIAFSLLIKFGDLLEDFVSLVDQVNYFNQFENSTEKANVDINQLLDILKELPQFTQVRNKWEEASKMRRWIQDKKSKLQLKYEKEVRDQLLKKKKDQDNQQQAQNNVLKEQEDSNQIDSSTQKSTLEKKSSKKDQKKMQLTNDEEIIVQDEAFNKVEKELESIFEQIKLKAEFLIKLQIPLQFLNKKNLFNQVELPKELEIEEENQIIKEDEKQHQDSDTISVGSNVLSLLQAPVQYGKIQEQVEKIYINAFKRVTGLKIISDLIKLDAPQFITKDIINWFCASLRANKNIITHYMDNISGQGTYLENKTRMYFFQVLNQILKNLKESQTVEDVKFYLTNGLLWRYMGRDHKNLYELNIFQALHKGNGSKNNIIKKCWGKYLVPGNFDQQSLPSDILDFFENLLLSIIARIIDSSDLKEIEMSQQLQAETQKKKNNLLALQKAKSVINEDLSENLFAQGYEIIFKELNRYVKIMSKLFRGIDWTTYVKSRQAKEDKNSQVNQKILSNNLLDEELDESEDEIQSDDDNKIELNDIQIGNQENVEEEKKKSEENEKKKLEERRKLRTELQLAQIDQIYQEKFLKKLLGIIEIFTNIQQQLIVQNKQNKQSEGQINYHRFQRLLKKLCSSSHIQTLLQILVLASPNTKFIVLRILQQLVQTQIVSFQVFDQAVLNLVNGDSSQNQSEVSKIYKIFNQCSIIPKYLQSPFILFLFSYLHQIRSKLWIKKQMEGEGVYSVSCEIVRMLRLIFETSVNFNQIWREDLQKLIDSMFQDYSKFSESYQIDLEIISSLIRGCEFLGMMPYQVGYINNQISEQDQKENDKDKAASKQNKKHIRIVGFVHKRWLQRSLDWGENDLRVYQIMKDSNQKVLVVEYQNEDLSDTKFQVYSPQFITLLNDFSQQQEIKNALSEINNQKDAQLQVQYEITSSTLDNLFKESKILDQSSEKEKDIHKLQQQATIMKLIHFNLENNPQHFMSILKNSKYYNELLRFVCEQQNNKNELDSLAESENQKITVIDWLEQKCAAIRLQACEKQACLIQQKEVKIQLVKDKLYVLTQPNASEVDDKNEFNMISIQLLSAINYQTFEEKKEFKLILESNVQIDEQNLQKNAQQQIEQNQKNEKLLNENEDELEQTDDIVLVRPENLQSENSIGLEILNQCKSIITYDVDFDELVGYMVIKQKNNKEKYQMLTSKTVFIVDQQDFNYIQDILNDKYQSQNQIKKQHENQYALYQKTLGTTPFEESLINEIITYGGFSRVVAEKIIKEGSLENKTLHFSKILKQIKDGVINVKELEEQRESEIQQYLKNQENNDNPDGVKKSNKRQFQRKKQKIEQKYFERSEEKSEMLNGFRTNFRNFLNNSDSNDNIEQLNNRHVYFQKVNQFYTTDNFEENLYLEYEQILKRLFQTYCRQIFWNLIQNDEIQTIFPKILQQSNKEDEIVEIQEQELNKQLLINSMRSFSNFIKIIGNECFITNDKKYIQNFKGFLKKVVQTCSQESSKQYQELLRIFLEECIIECYQDHFSELTGDDTNDFQKRIFEYFQSETKAQQLINPIVMIEIVQLIVEYQSCLIFDNLINLVSVLASVSMYFRGNQDLKTKFIEQIIRIIDLVQNEYSKGGSSTVNIQTLEKLVNLKIFDNYFQEIESPYQYDKEESKYAKTVLKDDSSKELNGFSRKNYERQVYLYRNQVHQRYIEFDQHRYDSSKIVIELAFKLKQLSESTGLQAYFCFQNNLVSYIDLYRRIISLLETNDIRQSNLNKYLTFYNSLDDQKKIYSHDIEIRNPDEGCDIQTLEVDFSGEDGKQIVEKVLTRIDGDSQFNSQGAAVFITQDIDGQNPIVMFNKTLFGKDQTLANVYSKGKKFYIHYPVFPNFTYTISINEEEPKFALLEKQLYEQFDDFCHVDQGVFYLGGNRRTLHILVDDKILKPYKNHLDTKRVNFGKRSIIMLLQSGQVYGFGHNKYRHFADQEAQKNFDNEQLMPFFDTKDQIETIETYKRITVAVTKNGHVYAIGDKLKKILKIKDDRFGFYKLPISQQDLQKSQDGPKEQNNDDNQQKQIPESQQEEIQKENVENQTLKAKNIWISKCKQQNNYVIYCLFENTETNNLEIHSIGKNIGGSLLGLGENIQEAFHFKKIEFMDPSDEQKEVKINSVEGVDIRCGLNHTIIGINNCEYVFVLGCYNKGQQAQEEIIFKPKMLSICQQYKIQKFDTEKNKTVIVAQKKDSEKIQVLVGQFAPLNKEDNFKTAQFDLDLSSKNSPNKIQQIYLRDQQAYLSFSGSFQFDPYNTGRVNTKKGFQANNLKQNFQYMSQQKQIGEKVKGSGLIMKLTPDYGFYENKDFIKHNQNDWDKFEKQLNEYRELMKDEPNGIKEFEKQLEDFSQKWLKDSNFLEMMTYWKNIKEKNDIDSSRGLVLKEYEKYNDQISFECKKFNIGLSSTYCSYIWGSLTYINKSINSKTLQNCLPLLSVFMDKKQLIPWSVINKMLKQHLNTLETDSENIAIHVNRKKSHEFAVSGQIDLKGEHTIYSQVQKKLETSKYKGMRINSSDKRAWFAKFIGEYAVDDGGLFRECLSEMCSELRSNVLPILIQTKNQLNNVGLDREMWVLNPGSTSDIQLKMIEFLGALMGMSFRSGILLDLYISKFTWKQIVGDEVTKDDLRMIDDLFVKDLDRILEASKSMSDEEFNAEFGETHTMSILLSNNQVVDLEENGRNIPLKKDKAELFYQKALEARLDESKLQVQSLVDGIDKTFDKKFLRIINWKYLEYKVVGSNEISVERLKEITSYRNCSETHDVIKRFWQVLDNFSNEDKISYLRFVWGRTRLPLKEEEVLENHTIQLDENASSARLPVGRTCFFRLELPPYESSQILKTKLLYSIHHCRNIDADYDRATVPNEEEAPNNNQGLNAAAAANPENEESDESEEQSRLHHNPGADEYSSDNTQELHEEEEEEEME